MQVDCRLRRTKTLSAGSLMPNTLVACNSLCVHSASGSSSKEVSSQSKESSNSKKTKQTISIVERVEELIKPEPIIPDPIQTQHQIQNQDKPQIEHSSEGYSRSPSPVNVEEAHIENIKKSLKPNVTKLSFPLKEKELSRKEMPFIPHVPIRPGTNRGTQIDPRIQFKEKLEEAKAENIERIKQSIRHLPSIPIIDIDADDKLEDLLKVI
ncbi:hypothetical protein PIB30_030337 [Stylosanthes scabra]|uniref:Uncharacterized protein n=1 Tax=Stylosanthes scabra TaxID=79078 RepID=A0ABU6UA97_9FABA|nr:hypothetical protein [Stylosanthes scabra]